MARHWKRAPAAAVVALGLLITGPVAAESPMTAEMADHCRVLVEHVDGPAADGTPSPAVLSEMAHCASYLRGIRAGFAAGMFAATSKAGSSSPPTEHTTNEQFARFFVRWADAQPQTEVAVQRAARVLTADPADAASVATLNAERETLRAEVQRLEGELATLRQALAEERENAATERAQYQANIEAQQELLTELSESRKKGSLWSRLFGGGD